MYLFSKSRVIGLIVICGALICFSGRAAVLAEVNGKKVTDGDLKNALIMSGMTEGQSANVLKDPGARMKFVDKLVDAELVFQAGEKDGLEKSELYQKNLEAYKKQLLTNLYVEKVLGPKMKEEDFKKFYKSNLLLFNSDQVRVQHILLSSEAEARKILEEAKKPNADFQALAEKHSKDPSAKNNRGEIGFIPRDRMVPEFSDAAFNAKVGEIIGPVHTLYGYHIIRVVERTLGKTLDYNEAEMQIKARLKDRLLRGLVDDLRKKAKITLTPDKG